MVGYEKSVAIKHLDDVQPTAIPAFRPYDQMIERAIDIARGRTLCLQCTADDARRFHSRQQIRLQGRDADKKGQ
jgi:hypothetical protein